MPIRKENTVNLKMFDNSASSKRLNCANNIFNRNVKYVNDVRKGQVWQVNIIFFDRFTLYQTLKVNDTKWIVIEYSNSTSIYIYQKRMHNSKKEILDKKFATFCLCSVTLFYIWYSSWTGNRYGICFKLCSHDKPDQVCVDINI